jgi:phosphocarrier protein
MIALKSIPVSVAVTPPYFRRKGAIAMFSKDVVVQNQVGLHARPATFFIQKANEFKASIWVEKEERRVNAKSLLGVLSLGIVGNTAIRVIADGADEEAAVEALVKLVESGFAE